MTDTHAPLLTQCKTSSLEILKAIVASGFPLATLRRFKDLITRLGGARTVARMLLRATTLNDFLVIGGPLLKEVGEILLGLKGVVGTCFSWI